MIARASRLLRQSAVAAHLARSPGFLVASAVLACLLVAAGFAPALAPHHPFDLASLDLLNARLPPAWLPDGTRSFPFGTDGQGRDVLSSLMYGLRISLVVGLLATVLSVVAGVVVGLVAGDAGGALDAVLMRLCDVMLSFPPILVALLVDGVGRALLPDGRDGLALGVLVLAIALTGWVPYARTVRGATMVERQKDYVSAARLMGASRGRILFRHVLPNVLGPVLVLATLQVGTAILIESTLSFLGVGVPPTSPSLGTLIRVGNELMLSGDWWIAVFPGAVLLLTTLSINWIGDALRDALNPKLR